MLQRPQFVQSLSSSSTQYLGICSASFPYYTAHIRRAQVCLRAKRSGCEALPEMLIQGKLLEFRNLCEQMFANAANYAIIKAEFKRYGGFCRHAFFRTEPAKDIGFHPQRDRDEGLSPFRARDMRRGGDCARHRRCICILRNWRNRASFAATPPSPGALELLDSPLSRGRSVPLVGKVTAGQPILAIENIEDYLIIPNDLAAQEADLFALRVQGESMIEAGILDGDIVVVHSQEQAENATSSLRSSTMRLRSSAFFTKTAMCAATGKPRHGAHHRRPRGCARQTRGARAAFLASLL